MMTYASKLGSFVYRLQVRDNDIVFTGEIEKQKQNSLTGWL